MKKRLVMAILAIFLLLAAAGAQLRFEIGAAAPVKVGYLTGDGSVYGTLVNPLESFGIIPVGNLGVFLQSDLGFLKLGLGAKFQTLLLATAAYPAVQAELALGPVFVDMSVGGYYVAYYTVGNIFGVQELGVLFPDASLWLGLGKKKNLRIGGGAVAGIPASLAVTEIPFVAYAGLKVVL